MTRRRRREELDRLDRLLINLGHQLDAALEDGDRRRAERITTLERRIRRRQSRILGVVDIDGAPGAH